MSSSSQSWACSKCTFINPPSQKFTCQICLSASNSPSSNSNITVEKWGCKACTFLNSYSRSNCEVCDTRASHFNLQDLDFNGVDGSSSVGTVFFPLLRCDSGRVKESSELGVRTQLGSCQFVDQCEDLNVGSNKRKAQHPNSENANNASHSPAKKEESGVAMKGLASAKIVSNTEDKVSFKRKLCDLGDYIDKSSKADGFCSVKSSKKTIPVLDSVKGSNFDKVGSTLTNSGSVSIEITENAQVKEVPGAIKILSYNVWFAEDVMYERMQAIGELIELHSPDVICFQEVTLDSYVMFQNSTWWKKYRCSISNSLDIYQAYFCMQLAKIPVKSFSTKPFSYSPMGRELIVSEVELNTKKSLVVATSHLESPSPGPPTWDQFYSKERVNQANEAVNFLQQFPNVIFGGDMNWDDTRDGQFPLAEGWFDAWEMLRPTEVGCTYDTKMNKMLSGNRSVRKRLDRFMCCLKDFEIRSIDMIGTEEIPGLFYKTTKKVKNKLQELTRPVFPSDHFGLLLTITSS